MKNGTGRLLLAAGLVGTLAATAFSAVTFTTNITDFGFNTMSVHEDFEGVTPKDTLLTSFTSNGIDYSAIDPPNNIVVSSPGYINYGIPGATTTSILTTNGNENFSVDPQFMLKKIGFDVYTINAPGEPNSVPGALDVTVTVYTTSGPTTYSLAGQPGNFGFLGIVSDEDILSITWLADQGGVRNTGIDNLRLVPEPASLAALSVGILAMMRKRRR